MKLSVKDTRSELSKCELVAVLGLQAEKFRAPRVVRVPPLALTAFKGEFRETRLTDALSGPGARFMQVGLGKRADVDHERIRRAAAIAVKEAEKARAKTLVLWAADELSTLPGGPASGP